MWASDQPDNSIGSDHGAHQRKLKDLEQANHEAASRQGRQPPPTGLLKVKEAVEISQKASLAAMKGGRDAAAVKTALASLEAAAQGTDNLMPHILEAVRAYATLGEIADVFRGVFGKHTETVVL